MRGDARDGVRSWPDLLLISGKGLIYGKEINPISSVRSKRCQGAVILAGDETSSRTKGTRAWFRLGGCCWRSLEAGAPGYWLWH